MITFENFCAFPELILHKALVEYCVIPSPTHFADDWNNENWEFHQAWKSFEEGLKQYGYEIKKVKE